jgi:CHASE2 domain-containing sensor protein
MTRSGRNRPKPVSGPPQAIAPPPGLNGAARPPENPAGAAPPRTPHRILHDAGIGVLLILAMVLIKVRLEHTPPMQRVSLATYDGIQAMLRADTCPIVVVDIGNIGAVNWLEGRNLTNRKTLGEIVAMIASQRPAAIGIDLDFSPNYDPLAAPGAPPTYHAPGREDPDFFDACLLQRQDGVPIFLGVYLTSMRPRAQMLVQPQYAELAADIRADNADDRLLPASFQWQAGAEEVPSMSAALAQAYRAPRAQTPSWLAWALHSEEVTRAGKDGNAREIYVDFSALDTLVEERVNFLDVSGVVDQAAFDSVRGRLAGKIVLLGTADPEKPKEGCFSVPGRRRAYPGVYLHAAAAYTQVHAPLLSLTSAGRFVVDLLAAGIVLAGVCLLRWRLARSRFASLQEHWNQWLPLLITMAAMTALFVVGVLIVNLTHVIWDDFVVVFVALGLHLPLERRVEEWRHARMLRAAARAGGTFGKGQP